MTENVLKDKRILLLGKELRAGTTVEDQPEDWLIPYVKQFQAIPYLDIYRGDASLNEVMDNSDAHAVVFHVMSERDVQLVLSLSEKNLKRMVVRARAKSGASLEDIHVKLQKENVNMFESVGTDEAGIELVDRFYACLVKAIANS